MRRLISSGSPFEAEAGYRRAVVDGEWVFVAGTTALVCGLVDPRMKVEIEVTARRGTADEVVGRDDRS